MDVTRDNNSFAIPPELMTELTAVADEQHRPIGDVVRELVEEGLEARHRKAHIELEQLHARELGMLDHVPPIMDDDRQTIHEKIFQGLQSLREGKGTDGGTFFSELYSERDAVEPQGRE